jgi:hypothetical protein
VSTASRSICKVRQIQERVDNPKSTIQKIEEITICLVKKMGVYALAAAVGQKVRNAPKVRRTPYKYDALPRHSPAVNSEAGLNDLFWVQNARLVS